MKSGSHLAASFLLLVAAASLLPARLPAQALVDDFLKAKTEFRDKRYSASMESLAALEKRLAQVSPGEREKIAPALAFYRGANLAMLGRRGEAVASFEAFLKLAPNASVDPAAYEKPVLSAFEEARKSGGEVSGSAEKGESGIVADYRSFRFSGVEETGLRGDFGAGPIARLMTAFERTEWSGLSSESEKAAFVVKFWERRDPTPGTPGNELRDELDRRIAFADARFRQGETRGSLTDRGEVFLLLGPPAYIGRRPLSASDDPSVGQQARDIEPLPPGASSGRVLAHNLEIDTNSRFAYGEAENYREVWHYRELPPGFPARSLDTDFVTRKGYGDHQLSRDARVLDVLNVSLSKLQPPR